MFLLTGKCLKYNDHRFITQEAASQLPTFSFMIEKENYLGFFDAERGNPRFIFEHLTYENLTGIHNRKKYPFKSDEKIPKIFRTTVDDYLKSGYDRGHMAACANYKSSKKEMEQTFYLSNVLPQNTKFNSGYWAKLEKHVRELAKNSKDLYVISGGLYLPKKQANGKRYVTYEVIGKNNIAVPTHYYKVIRRISKSAGIRDEAFLLPHKDIALVEPLDKFRVSIEEIEKLAGLLFFKQSHS